MSSDPTNKPDKSKPVPSLEALGTSARIPVGVLGATGTVGQRFIALSQHYVLMLNTLSNAGPIRNSR